MVRKTLLVLPLFAALAVPAGAQEREWSLDAADEDAYLVFGVPESDDVGVSFWCKIGSGSVKLYIPAVSADLRPDMSAPLSVSIDGTLHTVQGRTSANEATGLTSIEADFSADDPLVAALEKSDRFTVEVAGHKTVYPLADAQVDALISLCKLKK